jgi:uracil-DNA glycosylase
MTSEPMAYKCLEGMNNHTVDAPYLLGNGQEQRRRLEMLSLPHVKPLSDYLAAVRSALGSEYPIPNFDPFDGGVNARILFLLEAPGPKAAGTKISSGFVSSNNPDPTARNLWHLIHDAGIPRSETLIWNIVPWYVGTGKRIRPVNAADIRLALPYLKELLGLLPQLQLIVLVGRKAQSAEPQIRHLTALPIKHTYHMSGQVFNISPEKKRLTEEAFCRIAEFLNEN